MKSIYNFVVEPKGKRYNNTKKVGDVDLVLNTEMYQHQYVNREAVVLSTPLIGDTNIEVGDTVIVHHNVFRRWENQYGEEKNSRSYLDENTYFLTADQIFLYKKNKEWIAPKEYCFVKPIKSIDQYDDSLERPLIGVVKHAGAGHEIGDLVGFHPNSEYEFVVDGQRLYRVMTQFITIKYEYQGNEEEYNPSWADSR